MLLALSILGMFLSVLLLLFNVRKNTSANYLAIFFLLISISSFQQYVMLDSKSVFLVSVVFLNLGFLSFLIGPMLFWYVRSILTDNFHLKRRDIWHLLPMALFLIASFTHIISPWEHKVDIATKIVADANYMWTHQFVEFHNFPAFIVFLSRSLFILAYLFWSVILLFHYRKQKKIESVFVRQQFMTKWIVMLLLCLFILLCSHTLMLIESIQHNDIRLFNTLHTLRVFSGIGIIGLLISPFFFPAILYGLPQLPSSTSKVMANPTEMEVKVVEPEKHDANLEAGYLLLIQKKVDSCVRKQRPFLNPKCTIAHISTHTQIPIHHLAYFFKNEKKRHFHDCCNEWRVNHAKKLMDKGMANKHTIEALGIESGFSSKNSFFTAFKKFEGITPGAYAAKLPS